MDFQVFTAGQMKVEGGGLDQGTDALQQGDSLRFQWTSKQRYGAAAGALETEQHPNCRRLAGAVRSEESIDALRGYGEIQTADGGGGAVGFPDVSYANRRFHITS